MGKKLNQGKTTNLLKMNAAWRASPAPKEPDAVRFNASCGACGSIFFGDTQREADARKRGHQCDG